jgi:uncharacterized protein (DUF1778 family)
MAVENSKARVRNKDRMNFRISPEIKARVVRAAAITGQELTDFAVSTLNDKASAVLDRHDTIALDRSDYDFFLKVLDDRGRKPSKRSQAAARRYRQGRRSGVRYHL